MEKINFQGIFSILFILLAAPLFVGWINKQKAFLTGRKGAPILQPYYDLLKTIKKETIYAANSSFISRISPVISLVSTIVAGTT